MHIPFFKYQGAGNDFVLVDNRASAHIVEPHVGFLCDRRLGIGADGILVIEPSQIADYKMRIFNADGSEVSMCGNGLRCAFHFLSQREGKKALHIEVAGRAFACRWVKEHIAVDLGKPTIMHWPIQLALSCGAQDIYAIHTGVPHAIVFVADIMTMPLQHLGPEIRRHPAFAPEGVNVNCVQIAPESILVRTFERGVEGETLACGTGIAAAAWAAHRLYGLSLERIRVKTRVSLQTETFCDTMTVALQDASVEITGPATCVFSGEIRI